MPAAVPSPSTARASAAARLERLPFSGYHRLIFVIIAIAFFFDSVDLGTMTFVLGSIRKEFELSSAMAGLVASASFVGMAAGAAVAGLLADRFGRRPVFQWSMVLWGAASYLCSTAQSVNALILWRVLLGLGMGMEFPVAQTLLSEFVPTASRGRLIALMDGFWPLGFICAGVVSYFVLPALGWRTVFALLAMPAVFVLAVRRLVPESPRWLDHHGRHDEAERVLAQIEAKVMRSAGVTTLPAPLRRVEASAGRGRGAFREIWSGAYRRRTTMIWLLWFFALLGFYGLTSWLGALLQQAGYAVAQSVRYTVLISLGGVPGFLCAALAGGALGPQADHPHRAGRRRRDGLCLRADGVARPERDAADRHRARDAVLLVRHVGRALYLHARTVRHRRARPAPGSPRRSAGSAR